jgi:transcriptional regulator with XRE-family HTH domain
VTDLKQLGDKLSRIRLQLQMTESDVEAKTGIPAAELVEIEHGRSGPTGDQLLILSELFLVDYKDFLSNEKRPPFEQTEILYRMHGEHLATEDRWSIQQMLYFCENEFFLRKELGRGMPLFALPKPSGTYQKGQGWAAAQQVRSALNLKDNEIPVDVFRLFRNIGIHIFRRPLSNSNVSGLFIKHPVAGPCVLVNYSEDQYRQRFTVCHEVAHALLDAKDDEPIISLESDQSSLRELRANSFAGAFLVPPGSINGLSLSSISEEAFVGLCQKLMVNAKTLLIAFKNFNGATDSEIDRFDHIRIPKSSKSDPELGPDLTTLSHQRRQDLLESGLSYPYLRLCLDGYHEGKISLLRLSEVLLLDLAETTQLMKSFGEVVQ